MRFAENNRISHRQLYRQMILALLAPFMLCVFGKGGMNGISAGDRRCKETGES